jgi:hypothetical protein
MTNYENVMTGTVHNGKVRKLRADFTDSGYVEWNTADCEKGAAYRSINRMQLAATDKPVNCKRCLSLNAPAKTPEGFYLRLEKVNGFPETFRNVKTARSFLINHLADHEALGYRLDADAVKTLTEATGISAEELASKVAAKVRKFRREMGNA